MASIDRTGAEALFPAGVVREVIQGAIAQSSALPFMRRLPARHRLVLRGIGRNRRRSLSTILGVVLALVLVMAAWGMVDSLGRLMDRQFEQIQHDDASVTLAGPADDAAVQRIAAVDGVRAAERVFALPVSVVGGAEPYATQLFAFAPRTRMHDFDEALPADGVLLGNDLRERLALEEGDDVTVVATGLGARLDLRVAGFVTEPLGTFAYMRRDALLAALARAEPPVGEAALAGPESAVVLTLFEPDADRESVIRTLERLDGVAAVTDSRDFVDLVNDYLGLFYLFIGIMFVFGGLLAFALMFTTMSANTAERAAELATLRANGYSRRQVARLVVWENLLLTGIGIPIGLAAGYAVASALLNSWTTDMYAFDLYIAPLTYVWCALGMFAVTLASLWPSLRAADRMDIGAIVRQRSL
jgi:putative ABC transport system permease protein